MLTEKKAPVITLTDQSFKQFLLLMYGKTNTETDYDTAAAKEQQTDRLHFWNGLFRNALDNILQKGGAITGFRYVNGGFERLEITQFDHWPSNCMWVIQLGAGGQ